MLYLGGDIILQILPVLEFSENDVYTIKEIKIRKFVTNISSFIDLLNNYEDYSLSVLDRVPDKNPLVIDENYNYKTGNKVFTIGYPLGMAVKIDKPEDAEIKLVGKNTFQTNIDAFGGNSGGPVFDSQTKKIIGILVTGFGGEFDYEIKEDISFNVIISTDEKTVSIDPKTQIFVLTSKMFLQFRYLITQKYKGKLISNNDKYIAVIGKGTKINNRDLISENISMVVVIARLFGAQALNKGRFVRYSQDEYGTGVMKLPSSVIDLLKIN